MAGRQRPVSRGVWRWVAIAVGVVIAAAVALRPDAPARPARVTVFAAPSLAGALDDVAAAFTAARGDVEVVRVYGASAELARRIASGERADVFLSADTARVRWLAERGHVRGAADTPLSAEVVVARRATEPDLGSPRGLLALGRIALADPDRAASGRYARAALEGSGVWAGVAPRVAWMPDAPAALAAVVSGTADAAVVVLPEVQASSGARAVYRWTAGPDVRYGAARLREPEHAHLADELWTYLWHAEQAPLWAAHGFRVRSVPVPVEWEGARSPGPRR